MATKNDIQAWITKNKAMLEHLDLLDIIMAWEEYRIRTELMLERNGRDIDIDDGC